MKCPSKEINSTSWQSRMTLKKKKQDTKSGRHNFIQMFFFSGLVVSMLASGT
jgi:hypothetical protein